MPFFSSRRGFRHPDGDFGFPTGFWLPGRPFCLDGPFSGFPAAFFRSRPLIQGSGAQSFFPDVHLAIWSAIFLPEPPSS
jgi:hypothetical protein